MPDTTVTRITAGGGGLLAATPIGLYRSLDGGANWTATGLGAANVYSLAARGAVIFAGTQQGILVSLDNGADFEPMNTGLTHAIAHCLALGDGYLFAGVPEGGIWRRPLSEMGVTVAIRRAETRPGLSRDAHTEAIGLYDARGTKVTVPANRILPAGILFAPDP